MGTIGDLQLAALFGHTGTIQDRIHKALGNPRTIVFLTDFGAVGDNSTDNYLFLSNALSYLSSRGGGKLYVPLGTFKVEMAASPLVTVPSNVEIIGEGPGSVLSFEAGTVSAGVVFNLANSNVKFTDLTINFSGITTSTAFACAASNIHFDKCRLNSDHTASNVNTLHCFVFNNNGTHSGFTAEWCQIKNFRYGVLRSNDTTGTFTSLRFLNNLWEDNYANHIALNSPAGVLDDILVEGNTFRDCPGGDAFGTFAIMLGMANATNYRILGNHFEGVCKDAIHLEELGGQIIVSNNTMKLLDKGANTNGGRSIFVTNSNIGNGTYYDVRKIVISNNILQGKDRVNADAGIYIADQAGGSLRGADRYIISNNIVSLFAEGFYLVDVARTASIKSNLVEDCDIGIDIRNDSMGGTISDNTIYNCTTGIHAENAWPGIRDNYIFTATTGIEVAGAGSIGDTKFNNVTTPIATTVAANSTFLGWNVEDEQLTIAASPSTTNITLFPFPTRCHGRLRVSFFPTDTAYQVDRYWDIDITTVGTVTATLVYQRTTGVFATSGAPFDSSGNLVVAFTNSGTENATGVLQVTFDGFYEV